MTRLLARGVLLLAAAALFFHTAAPTQAQADATVWDGVYTEAQAKRGEAFGAEHCAGCHGIDLNSGEPGPWMFGKDFALRYDNHTVEDVVRRLNSMPPDDPGVFGPQAAADFAAFVLWSNNFPAGSRELPITPEALRRIRITVRKP